MKMSREPYLDAIVDLLNGPKFAGRLEGCVIQGVKAERIEGKKSHIRLMLQTDKSAFGIWPTELYLDHIGLAPKDLRPPRVNPNRDPEDSPMFTLRTISFKVSVNVGGKDYACLDWGKGSRVSEEKGDSENV